MSYLFVKQIFQIAIASIALTMASSASAQNVRRITTFATGTAVNATGPDSITLTRNSVWVSYTNGADSTGLSGSSTIVQYKLNGEVRHTYSIAGSVDGLKFDPRTGRVWALQNQDGNSTLSVINPKTHNVTGPIPYAVKSATQGYDDVVFRSDQVFLSYTNPVAATDPTIQLLQNGSNPQAVPTGSVSGVFSRTAGVRRLGGAEPSSPARGQLANERSRTECRKVSCEKSTSEERIMNEV